MHILDEVVKTMLEEHKGGEKFFDHLDMEIQNHYSIVEQLYKNLVEKHVYDIVVSGKFGVFFNNYVRIFRPTYHYLMTIIVVNGSLRKGVPVDDLSYMADRIKDKSFIFVDDSFYSGKTRDAIQAELSKYGGIINQTLVVYDGSLNYDESVDSLYRYHKEK